MKTPKAQTNAKWTSSDKHRDNYDRIFGKKEVKQEDDPTILDKIKHGSI